MGRKVDKEGRYVFDQDYVDDATSTRTIASLLWGFLSNRFAIVSFVFVFFGVVIFIMTASLQLSDLMAGAPSVTGGVRRQYQLAAPRGDIMDRNGITLASSEKVTTLMVSHAGLTEPELNKMLLELSYLIDQYNATPVFELADYLIVDSYEFKKDEDEIMLWQTNRNLFNLEEPLGQMVVTYSDKYVKKDPQVFFLYLRSRFGIDATYDTDQAYRIACLRYQIFKDNWAYLTGTPIMVATDVPDDLVSYLSDLNYRFMGVISGYEYRRIYSPHAATSSHVVGYVGRISQDDYLDLQPIGYAPTDIVGKAGIESQMERYIRGQPGIKPYNIWSTDMDQGAFYPENIGMDSIPGARVELTIDTRLQEIALEELIKYIELAATEAEPGYKSATSGAVVMMDVHTGEVLVMVSYPDYDPNDFVLSMYGDETASDRVEYYLGVGDYAEDAKKNLWMPLWNRAIFSQYPPGSTFKMVPAVAGLESGVITPQNNYIECTSPVEIGGWPFRCLDRPDTGHGYLTLVNGMAFSCNIYFQQLGVRTGINEMDYWGKRLGLGELTGIDLPGEIAGVRSNRENKSLTREKVYDKTWFPADTAQTAIGQFDNAFTILQLARYAAALATNQLVTPHVISRVIADDGSLLYSGTHESVPVGMSESTMQLVRQGMIAVTDKQGGTAYRYLSDMPIRLASKTGTAETGFEDAKKEYSHGLFVCYAPADDPEVAIALVVEHGEWGSSTTVIARKLLLAYFGLHDPKMDISHWTDPPIGDDALISVPDAILPRNHDEDEVDE